MGFDEGQIVLNNDNKTYFPGQMLYGRLEFDLNKDKKFRGIYADITGKCKVHWTTSHTRRVNDRTEHYTVTHESHEEYMNVTIYLMGSKNGEHTLHPGHHVFPFECLIPVHCPSSFEGSEGSVRYEIKITVDRAFKLDQTKITTFKVDAPLDLNTNPYCKEPIAFEFEQTFCCWCMNSGGAETIIKLQAGGWCPKQIIPIEVACTNTSSVEIDKIIFSIIKTTSYEAVHEPDTRSETEVIAKLKKGPVPGNTTRNWTAEMEVPDVDVPNLNTCRFINIDHNFKVEIATSGCHTDEDQTRRIFIGTIPLASLQYPPNSTFENVQNKEGVTSYPIPPITNQPLPNYPNGSPFPGSQPPYPVNMPNIGFNAEKPPYPVVSPFPGPTPYPVSPNVGASLPYPAGNTGANQPYVTSPHVNSSVPYPSSNPGMSPFPTKAPYPDTANMETQPAQNPAVSPYPISPIVGTSLPYPNSPNVGANTPYPNTQNVGANSPDPNSQNVGTNPPYPNSPNAGPNPPYPNSPNASTNPPYPNSPNAGPNPPYPISPNVVTNTPYPDSPNAGTNSPYPPQNTHASFQNSPYNPSSLPYTPGKPAQFGATGLKTGNIGFPGIDAPRESMPLLPPSAMPRPTSPFASASAPPPSTPDDEKKVGDNIPPYPQ